MTRPRPGPGSRFPRPPGRPPTPRPGCFWGSSKVPDKIMILDENKARRGAGFKIRTPGPGLTHTSRRATFAPKILSGAWGRPRIFCGRGWGGVHPEGPDFCQFRNWLLGCTKAGIAGTECGSEHAPKLIGNVSPGPSEDVPLPSGTHANLTQSPSPPSKNSHCHHAPSWQTPGRASKSRMCGCKKLSWQRIREP